MKIVTTLMSFVSVSLSKTVPFVVTEIVPMNIVMKIRLTLCEQTNKAHFL